MTLTTEDAVRDVEKGGGENGLRFQVKVPTADLKGENTIVVIAKLADGTVVAIDDTLKDYVHGYATASPNTTFTYNGAAEATEAPTAEPEATKAPEAEATKAPEATKEPEKKGCGSVVTAGAVVVLAACALVIRKKED